MVMVYSHIRRIVRAIPQKSSPGMDAPLRRRLAGAEAVEARVAEEEVRTRIVGFLVLVWGLCEVGGFDVGVGGVLLFTVGWVVV